MRSSLLMLLCAIAVEGRAAGTAPQSADSAAQCRQGIIFDLGLSPHLSSPASYAPGPFEASLGFGYVLNRRFELAVEIYSGTENIPAGTHVPEWGFLQSGAASCEVRYFLTDLQAVRPFAVVAYELSTVLDGGGHGYNGGGPQIALGLQFELSDAFAVTFDGAYSSLRYHDPVTGSDPRGVFRPFTDSMLSVGGRVMFYTGLVP